MSYNSATNGGWHDTRKRLSFKSYEVSALWKQTTDDTVVPWFPDIWILNQKISCFDIRNASISGFFCVNIRFMSGYPNICTYAQIQILMLRNPNFNSSKSGFFVWISKHKYDLFQYPYFYSSITGHSISGFLLSGDRETTVFTYKYRGHILKPLQRLKAWQKVVGSL